MLVLLQAVLLAAVVERMTELTFNQTQYTFALDEYKRSLENFDVLVFASLIPNDGRCGCDLGQAVLPARHLL